MLCARHCAKGVSGPASLEGSEGVAGGSKGISLGPLRLCWHWVPLGCLLDSQPLTMKWFHIDRHKKPQTNQTTTKNQTPFWMWVLMRNIIMEPAAPPSPLSPSQASLRRAWLQMAFSCLGGAGRVQPLLALHCWRRDFIFN